MSKTAYDILRTHLPETLFRTNFTKNLGTYKSTDLTIKIIGSVIADPLVGLNGTSFTFRINNSPNIVANFTSDIIAPNAINTIQNAATAAGFAGYISTVYNSRLTIYALNGNSIEVMSGNELLGFYEQHAIKALLKIMAPEIDQYREDIKSISEIIDVDNAPLDFLKQLGILLNYKWKESLTEAQQRKLIKQQPFVYQFKGTIPSIERIVRIAGGNAEIFEPYQYISRYEEDAWDGERVFNKSGTRFFVNGQTYKTGELQYFSDTTNAPFTEDDEDRYLFIPGMPGPVQGFKINAVLSPTVVEIPSANLEDATNVHYLIKDPPRVYNRLESRDFWHEGVYEVIADIPAQDYAQDVIELVHPSGRIVYFQFRPEIATIADETEDPVNSTTIITDLQFEYGAECGAAWEEGAWEEDDWDGCQVIFGFDVATTILLIGSARRPLGWSDVLHFEDVAGIDVYQLPEYANNIDINAPNLLIGGHTYADEVTDVQPTAHVIYFALTTEIDADGNSTNDLAGILPVGAKILLVNASGTFNKTTSAFVGGTDYAETTDWVQVANTLEWQITPPVALYRIYYSFDSYNLFS